MEGRSKMERRAAIGERRAEIREQRAESRAAETRGGSEKKLFFAKVML